MTGASDTINAAARFLVETPLEKRIRPTVPLLAEKFGLPPAGASLRSAARISFAGRRAMQTPDKANPAARASANRVLGTYKCGTAFDNGEDTTLRERQARVICERFATSFPLALVIADLAYTGRACA